MRLNKTLHSPHHKQKRNFKKREFKSPITVLLSTTNYAIAKPKCYVKKTRLPVAPGSAVG